MGHVDRLIASDWLLADGHFYYSGEIPRITAFENGREDHLSRHAPGAPWRPDPLLMDERMGRDTARHFGLRYTGVVGVLIEAKHKGYVQAIQPHLDALRDLAGFRVSEALYRRVLQDEGEI